MGVTPDAVGAFIDRELALSAWCHISLFVTVFLAVGMSLVVVFRLAVCAEEEDDDEEDKEAEHASTRTALSVRATRSVAAAGERHQVRRSGGSLYSEEKKQAIRPTLPRYTSPGRMPPQSSTDCPSSRQAPRRPVQGSRSFSGLSGEEKKQASRSTPPIRPIPTRRLSSGLYGEEKDQPSRPTLPKHRVQVEIFCEPGFSTPRLCDPRPCSTVLESGRSPSAPVRDRPMLCFRAAEMVRSFSDEPKGSRPNAASSSHTRHSSPSQHLQRPQQVVQAKPRVAHLSSSSKYYAEVVKRQSEMSRTGMLGAPLCKNLTKQPEACMKAPYSRGRTETW